MMSIAKDLRTGVLIVPCGMETHEKSRILEALKVLIVPCGMET